MRAITLMLVACGPIQFGEDNADNDKAPADTGDTGEAVDPADGNRPEVTAVLAADCIADVNGIDNWGVVAQATDPQGVTTLAEGHVELLKDAQPLGSKHPMTCVNGNCSAGWVAEENEPCSVSDIIVSVVAVDEDGYSSYAYEVSY